MRSLCISLTIGVSLIYGHSVFAQKSTSPPMPASIENKKITIPDKETFDALMKIERHKQELIQEENATLNQLMKYPASLKTSILRMSIRDRIKAREVLFDAPETIDKNGSPEKYLFHKTAYALPDDRSVTIANTRWIFSSHWQIHNVGTNLDDVKSNELIAFLPNIPLNLCLRINDELGIKPQRNDKNNNGVPGAGEIDFLPTDDDSMTSKNPGFLIKKGEISNSFSGKIFGCFDSNDKDNTKNDGPYVYFHALTEN